MSKINKTYKTGDVLGADDLNNIVSSLNGEIDRVDTLIEEITTRLTNINGE